MRYYNYFIVTQIEKHSSPLDKIENEKNKENERLRQLVRMNNQRLGLPTDTENVKQNIKTSRHATDIDTWKKPS